MIKIMFKPFFKKYVGLFISMVFVSMLSIALLVTFASSITTLQETYKEYLEEYGKIDGLVKVGFTTRESLDGVREVEGVDNIEYRLTIDARLQKDDNRIITSRIYSYNDETDKIFHRYVLDSCPKNNDAINVSVVNKFAKNNDIKLGDTIRVGFYKTYVNLYVNEIVETPESIQVRANDYVWSDNTDFGYIYVHDDELDRVLYELAVKIDDKIKNDPEYKQYYDMVVAITGLDVPDLASTVLVDQNFVSKYANQILVQKKEGYAEEQVVKNVAEYLESEYVTVKEARYSHQLIYILYLENAVKQLRVASVFLPVFFYAVTMIIIILFINQIIKSMTKEIGVMMSIGVGFTDIRSIFLFFTLLMSIISSILGLVVSVFLDKYLTSTMSQVYSLPTLVGKINVLFAILACFGLIIFSELATMISCRGILRITPKDATISNEAKRKKLPKFIANFIEKAPMAIKLGVNSIFQNLRRFIVSTFSIFAAFVIILLALFFHVSKTELIEQSVERRLAFDAQVYLTGTASDETKETIKSLDCVTAFEDCYYTYIEATNGDNSTYLECLAYDPNTTQNLVSIPDKKGTKSISLLDGGIILPLSYAKKLGVGVGDSLSVNGKETKIIDISNQYFHPITYLSKDEMDRLEVSYVSSFLVNITDETEFLEVLDVEAMESLTVFTHNLEKDIRGIFDSINIFIFIIIMFSFGMGFIILVIMSQNALMEQQRQITVYRAIGFRIINISNLWTLQSVSQLIFSTLFALPMGSLFSYILFSLCSSATQIYPFIFSVKYALIAFLFILLIIIITHVIAMLTIRRWNIADNTRCRE